MPPIAQLFRHPKTGELQFALDAQGRLYEWCEATPGHPHSSSCWVRKTTSMKDGTKRRGYYADDEKPQKKRRSVLHGDD